MVRFKFEIACGVCLLPILLVGMGCQDMSLPSALLLAFPDGTTFEAPAGSGVPSFADSTWSIYDDQDELMVRVEIGAAGKPTRFFDNRLFEPNTIGEEIFPDGQQHSAPFPGSSYIGECYGGELDASIAFTGHAKFFIGPVLAARSTMTVSGTLNDAGNRFDGTFVIVVEVEPEFEAVLDGTISTGVTTHIVRGLQAG